MRNPAVIALWPGSHRSKLGAVYKYLTPLECCLIPFDVKITFSHCDFILVLTRNIRNMTCTCQTFSPISFLPILQAHLYTRLEPSLIQLLRKQPPDEQLLRLLLVA